MGLKPGPSHGGGVTSVPGKRKRQLSTDDNRCGKSGRLDSNQRPLRPERDSTQSQGAEITPLTNGDTPACTNSRTSNAENGPNQAGKLEVIADLLADLPEAERRAVISELAPDDRVAVARLLIARPATEGKGETP